MAVIDTLRCVPFLAPLMDNDLDWLAARLRPRQYRAGTTIFHHDDSGTTLHVIERGTVKLMLTSPEGREITVDLLGAGGFFGELALLDGGPRSASAVALEATETLTLEREAFVALLEAHPQAALRLLGVIGERLRRADELIGDLLFLDLPGRLAKQLLALAEERGSATPRGVRIDLRLSQSELAAMVGATRESVNRCLNAYAERGILDFDRETITCETRRCCARGVY